MNRLASKISRFLRATERSDRRNRSKLSLRKRLEFEVLEDRCLPTATASGVISGVAYVDSFGSGSFNSLDATIPGLNLTLTGTTSKGTPVHTTITTTGNGAFSIGNVLPGTYGISGTGGSVIVGSPNVSGLTVTGGQTLTENVGFVGLVPGLINMRMFLSSVTSTNIPFSPAGSGTGIANFRPNNAPIVIRPIEDVSVGKNSPQTTVIDLATHVTDPDLTFRIDTTDGPINVQLFYSNAPNTVTNFLNYALSGAYNNSFFHRLATGFVLQGGGFTFDAASSTVNTITANAPIKNEFGISNTQGTLAMAQSGGDPNSATDEFYFNLVDNSASLDPQKFAVFGKIVGAADQTVLTKLASTPIKDESSFNAAFKTLPLNNYSGSHFPTDASATNFIQVNDVTAINSTNETLTYTVVNNTNPNLVTAATNPTDNTQLNLSYAANQTGSAVITVKATDRYNVSVTDSFTVTVNEQKPTATVAISPSAPLATDTVTATATASDPDNTDSVNLTYQWQVNGNTVQTVTHTSSLTNTLNLNGIAKLGDMVTVSVTPNDGFVDGAPVTSTVTVANPTAVTLSFSPSSPTSTDTLSATLAGSNAHSFTYQWTVNSKVVQTDTISATTDVLNQTLHSGDQISLLVTPSDGTNTGTPTSGSVTVA